MLTREEAKPSKDRRRYKRVFLTTAIDLESDLTRYSGYTRDISEGGVFVVTDRPFQEGDPLDLKLSGKNGDVLGIRCRVAWVQKQRRNGKMVNTGVGLQFTRIPMRAQAAIARFIETGDASSLLFHTEEDTGLEAVEEEDGDIEPVDHLLEMVSP